MTETAVLIAIAVAVLLLLVGGWLWAFRIAPRMVLLRISLGVIFFILGIVGSLLPVMQGWLFFLLSALMFFPNSRFAEKVLAKVEPKMPKLVARLRKFGIGQQQAPTP